MKRRLKNSPDTADVLQVDAANPDPDAMRRAAGILGQQGLLVFPTSGVYGLGADAFSEAAVGRVFAIKRRSARQPVLVLLPDLHDMERLVQTVPDDVRPLLGLWPGGITFIFKARTGVPAQLSGGTGTIGVRLPAHAVARALVEQFGAPITGTSANLSGCPAVAGVADLDPAIRGQVELVLDAGRLAGGPGSTILDVTCRPVRVIREGVVSRRTIEQVLKNG